MENDIDLLARIATQIWLSWRAEIPRRQYTKDFGPQDEYRAAVRCAGEIISAAIVDEEK